MAINGHSSLWALIKWALIRVTLICGLLLVSIVHDIKLKYAKNMLNKMKNIKLKCKEHLYNNIEVDNELNYCFACIAIPVGSTVTRHASSDCI